MPRKKPQEQPKVVPQSTKPAPAPKNPRRVNGAKPAETIRSVAPASIRKELDAAPHAQTSGEATMVEKGPEREPVIKVTEPQLEPGLIEVLPRGKKKSEAHLKMLQFMREPVTVHIHETSDKNADPRFIIGVNGRNQTFVRGKEYTVPRYVVEGLARAKPVAFKNEEFFKPDGERAVRWPSVRGTRYPFSVIGDSDRGNAWLKQVLRQP